MPKPIIRRRPALAAAALAALLPLAAAPAAADPAQYLITARQAFLVGGEGDTGDSFRYDGSEIWTGPGIATIDVNDRRNDGVVIGTVHTHGHVYTIVLDRFAGEAPWMDGGIAADLALHGTSGHGPPVLPKVHAYLAGWGQATVYKDGQVLLRDADAHFMLTQGVRDKRTHRVAYAGPKKLMMAKRRGDRAALKEAMAELKRAEAAVDPSTMQLHVVAHTAQKDPSHFPPFKRFMHFMWDEVTWH